MVFVFWTFFCFAYALPFIVAAFNHGPFEIIYTITLISIPILVLLNFSQNKINQAPSLTAANSSFVKKIFLILLFLYVIFRMPQIQSLITSLSSASVFLQKMQDESVSRYAGDEESFGIMFNIGTILCYGLFFFAPHTLSHNANNAKVRRLIVISLVSTLIIEISDGSRARVLIAMLLFFVEFMLVSGVNFDKLALSKKLCILSLVVMSLFVLFFVPQYARVYDNPAALEIVLYTKLPNYTVSMYDAFFIWLSNWDGPLTLGQESAAFIYKMFGMKYKAGLYEPVITSFGETNIYTTFRQIISDFGLLSPHAFLFLTTYFMCRFQNGCSSFSVYFLRFLLIIFFFPLYSAVYFSTTFVAIAGFSLAMMLCGQRMVFKPLVNDT